MRHLLSAVQLIRLHATRLREPLVQVWLMAGMALVLVIIGHVHAVRQSGDWKNPDARSAARLLIAGASLQWSDDFAPAGGAARPRPAIALAPLPALGRSSGIHPGGGADLDWRGEMTAAASRPWKHLGKTQRQVIDQVRGLSTGLSVSLVWTGDPRGNAALYSFECRRLGLAGPGAFVIGNGSRSGNGSLEMAGPLLPSADAPVVVTLIGSPDTVTAPQKAALGELLNYLEARFGAVQCLAQ